MSDIPESTDPKSVEEFLSRTSVPGTGSQMNQSYYTDDMVIAVKLQEERTEREKLAIYAGREWQQKRYETAIANKDRCDVCHRYGIYEELPYLKNLVDAAIEIKYAEYSGEGNEHLRRHIAYHHPELVESAMTLFNKVSDHRAKLRWLRQINHEREYTAQSDAERSKLSYECKEVEQQLLAIVNSDKEVAEIIDREVKRQQEEEQEMMKLHSYKHKVWNPIKWEYDYY